MSGDQFRVTWRVSPSWEGEYQLVLMEKIVGSDVIETLLKDFTGFPTEEEVLAALAMHASGSI